MFQISQTFPKVIPCPKFPIFLIFQVSKQYIKSLVYIIVLGLGVGGVIYAA